MEYILQIIFAVVFFTASFFIYKSIVRIKSNILLGRKQNRYDKPGERFKKMIFYALGQKKMFKKPIPAILHLFVYLGFIIVNIEILEIIIDGITGGHRTLFPVFNTWYPFLINVFEFMGVSVIISCIIFLIRRNIIKVNRFKGEEMRKWPVLDANIILVVEICLMSAFLIMNASDSILQSRGYSHYMETGSFFFSSFLTPLFEGLNNSQLVAIERFCWWFHICGVLLFANYVFYDSKHLHIFISFPNTYFSNLEETGKWENMSSVTKEVKLMLNIPTADEETQANEQPVRFGAKDVQDLSWKNLMDAYSCTECGRCTQQCPANNTGKKLSPRKIMMDTRDRLEVVGKNIREKGIEFNDEKSLLDDYITAEELLACTSCHACIEACPVSIDPLNIIIQLRQYRVMEASQAPGAWNNMFSNIENNFAPWKFSPSDRIQWAEKLND